MVVKLQKNYSRESFIKGDPLSPFLFLVAMEGLSGLFHNSTRVGVLKGFKVNDNLHDELLQFANDTMVVCDGSWTNL